MTISMEFKAQLKQFNLNCLEAILNLDTKTLYIPWFVHLIIFYFFILEGLAYC